MLNVAFYDERRNCLVEHEQVPMSRSSAGMAAIQMGLMWKSGRHALPSRYWVVWEQLEDLGIFPLHLVDTDGEGMPSPDLCDRIAACARSISASKS